VFTPVYGNNYRLSAHGRMLVTLDHEGFVADSIIIDGQVAIAVIESGFGIPESFRIEFRDITPEVRSIDTGLDVIDANNPRTANITAQWIDAIDTITINGQNIPFTPFGLNGRIDTLVVDLPALPQGRHRVILNGPLGQSVDQPNNYITVAPPLPRARVEVLARADSANGQLAVSASCRGARQPIDLSVTQTITAGERVVLNPVIGHQCSVSFRRSDGGPANDWHHFTTGSFDPATDADAWDMLDTLRRTHTFAVEPQGTAIGVFMPELDERVVWTYSYGFGSVPDGARTPVTLRCPGGSRTYQTYQTYLGYWQPGLHDRARHTEQSTAFRLRLL
jgi:hypothetical protein